MDIIGELIKRKESSFSLLNIVETLIDELIIFEKLQKVSRFKDFSSPLAREKCPMLYQATLATLEDTVETYILRQLLPYIVTFSKQNNDYLPLVEQTERMEIINNTYGIKIVNVEYIDKYIFEDADIWLEQQLEEQISVMGILVNANKKTITIGSYTTEKHENTQENTRTHRGSVIDIDTFSLRGNNDYTFGHIDEKGLSIDDGHLWVNKVDAYSVDTNRMSLLATKDDVLQFIIDTLEESGYVWKD